MAENTIDVHVRTSADKSGLDSAKKDAAAAGQDAGDNYSKGFLSRLFGRGGGAGGGSDLGTAVKDAGSTAAQHFSGGFLSTVAGSKAQMITALGGTLLSTLPALAGVAGVGMVAALGVGIASRIPAVHQQFVNLGHSVMGTLKQAVQPMVPFITGVVSQVAGFMKSIEPELSGLFRAVGPALLPLTEGIEGLVKGLLPGLLAVIKAVTPVMGQFAGILSGVGRDLGSMFAAAAPAMKASMTVLGDLMGAVGALLPVIMKLAGVFASLLAPVLTEVGGLFRALEPTIEMAGRILGLLAQAVLVNLAGGLKALAGMLIAVAPAFGRLVSAIGQAFTLMENRGVLNDFEDAIEGLVGPIGKLASTLLSALAPAIPPVIQLLGAMADLLQSGIVTVIAGLAKAMSALISAIPPSVMTAIAEALLLWVTYMKMIGPVTGIIKMLGPAFSFVTGLAPKLAAFASSINLTTIATKLWAGAQAVLNAIMDANPFVLIAAAVIAVGVAIYELWTHSAAFRDFFIAAWHDILSVVSDVVDWVKSHWPLLLEILTGPIGIAAAFIIGHWHDIVSGAQQMVSDLVGFFTSLPGRILSAVSSFGHLLWSAGADLLNGLIGGIESMVSDVIGTVEHVGSDILGGIKNALGIGSPSKYTFMHGQMVGLGLIGGMDSMRGQIAAAAGRMAGAAIPRGYPGAGAGAGTGGAGGGLAGGGLTLEFRIPQGGALLPPQFWTEFANGVRSRGGSPQIINTKVSFA